MTPERTFVVSLNIAWPKKIVYFFIRYGKVLPYFYERSDSVSVLFSDIAFAMAPGQGGEAGAGSGLTALFPLVIMFVIFYFLLIRPQQKKAKQHQQFLSDLKKDDMVVTTGGIHGKVTGMTDNIITLEIAPNVRIKVSRSGIAGFSETAAKTSDEKPKEK